MTSPTATHRPPPLVLNAVSVDVLDGTRGRRVLDAVSVTVTTGEMVAVMGPSGAGKSTLLGVACGLVTPSVGRVRVHGEEPALAREAWWAQRRRNTIGVIHQQLNLLDGLTALDNAALAGDLQGLGHRHARRLASAALDRAGVGHVADTFAERLSVGEQQRVAIARAITGDRPLVLADEPSAALDRTSADEVSALLADLAHEGRAVLLVTHDAQLASWADRTLVLRDGRTVDEVSANPSAGR